MASDDSRTYLMPYKLSGSPEIEKQDITLTIDVKTIEGSRQAYYAELRYMDGRIESCIAVCKRTSLVFETFKVLNACSHPNIAKPVGFWEDKTEGAGYIVFQNFDGVLSSVPKDVIFEVEDLSEQPPAIWGFSKTGLNILSDVVSAVKYVNDHYQQEPTQSENSIPLKPLSIETDTIFYQLKADGDYLVLLSNIEIDTGGDIQNEKGGSKAKGKAKGSRKAREKAKTGKSGGEPDVHKIRIKNWNSVGSYIAQLYGNWSANFEVMHLVGRFKEEGVKYDDLVWEAGLWDLNTKVHFIREIFWCYDKDATRKGDLYVRNPLGLQDCIDKLHIKETRNKGSVNETTRIMLETNLFKSITFLRVFILAHQAEVLEGIIGPKVDVPDKKSAERFVLKRRGDYMVNLVKEIRALNWFNTSPYLRSGNNYMSEYYNTPQEK